MMQQQGMQRWPATSCSSPDAKENDKIALNANDHQRHFKNTYSSCQSVCEVDLVGIPTCEAQVICGYSNDSNGSVACISLQVTNAQG